tara:strand:- start:303 stop:593 length:291 start_codon:yes stop_codon:yes gene_type:complete
VREGEVIRWQPWRKSTGRDWLRKSRLGYVEDDGGSIVAEVEEHDVTWDRVVVYFEHGREVEDIEHEYSHGVTVAGHYYSAEPEAVEAVVARELELT